MKKILEKVSVANYKAFRKMAMEQCGWSVDQYANRYSGVTKLTAAEEIVLNQIVESFNSK